MKLSILRFGTLALAVASTSCTGKLEDNGPAGPGSGWGAGTGDPSVTTPWGVDGGATAPPDSSGSGRSGGLNLKGSPLHFRVVRLTNSQWENSVQQLFGLSAAPAAAQAFQDAVSGTTDFTNNELVLDVDSRRWMDYQAAAEQLAAEVTRDEASLARVYPGTDAAGFIRSVGRRVYRRPLTASEVEANQSLFDLGAAMSGSQSSFAKGAAVVLEAMLQSPYFLYRTELGPLGAPLTGYEVAAKLSLWLRDTTPDDALLDAAQRGELDSPAGVATMAQRMLDEPAAVGVMREFHGQLLHFDRFAELSKVGVPDYDESINPELEEASYLFFDRVFSENYGLEEVFVSTSGFVGPNMAELYALPTQGAGFEERDLGAGRAGFFTQLPYLMLYAHNDEPDAIHRGVTMSLDVLCAPLGPPAAVIPPLPIAKPGQTNRQRVDEHTSGCGGACHNQMINPLGFAFENFDGMGRFREMERHGVETLPIDASGMFNFISGTQVWQNAAELMDVLATDSQTHLCYAKKLAGFGLQRDIVQDDMPLLETLAQASQNGSLKQVATTLVQHDAFRTHSGDSP